MFIISKIRGHNIYLNNQFLTSNYRYITFVPSKNNIIKNDFFYKNYMKKHFLSDLRKPHVGKQKFVHKKKIFSVLESLNC